MTTTADRERINRAIAQFMGVCMGVPTEYNGAGYGPCPKCGETAVHMKGHDIAPYTTDLNAVALAEKAAIEKVGFDCYFDALLEVVHQDENPICATALQRAEAVCRALNLDISGEDKIDG